MEIAVSLRSESPAPKSLNQAPGKHLPPVYTQRRAQKGRGSLGQFYALGLGYVKEMAHKMINNYFHPALLYPGPPLD